VRQAKSPFFDRIARRFPQLDMKLTKAGIHDTTAEFIRKVFIVAFLYTTMLNIAFFFVLVKMKTLVLILFAVFPLSFIILFFYFIKIPEMKIVKRKKEIDKELVFAGRFLLIELASGVPLYDSLKNIARTYPSTGSVFQHIVDKVNMGTTMEKALQEAVEESPSENCQKVLWQIINSLQTGSDAVLSLRSIIDQIAKEQLIEVNKYGKKLNPLAMFYMMIAIIVPSLGIAMLVVLSSLMSFSINLPALFGITAFLGFIQFMFITMVKSARPSVEL